MKIEYQTNDAGLDITFIEEHARLKWFGLVAAVLVLLFFIPLAWVMELGVGIYLGIVFLLAIIFSRLYVLFGVSMLQITEDRLILIRSLFFLRTTRSYLRQDVESIGFVKEFNAPKSHQDSGLSLMVRQNVTPVLFARTVLPEEAKAVFGELSEHSQWLAPLIRPVGVLPF